jgi:hypothetical protein
MRSCTPCCGWPRVKGAKHDRLSTEACALYKIYPEQNLGLQQSAIANIMMDEFKNH